MAALTLPAAISNYKKHVIATQLEKTYADLEKWIKASEVDNGSYEEWDYTLTSEEFVQKYFAPYMGLKNCTNVRDGHCFAGDQGSRLNMWKKSNGQFENYGMWLVYAPKYIMQDGRYFALYNKYHYSTSGFGGEWKYVNFIIDVNGARGESILGKDVYVFTLFNYTHGKEQKGLRIGTISGGGGDFRLPSSTIRTDCTNSGYSCGLLIQRNGWKFPKDYPLKI